MSAAMMNSPKGPARFGPTRSWNSASSRRSIQIISAAMFNMVNRTRTTMRSFWSAGFMKAHGRWRMENEDSQSGIS